MPIHQLIDIIYLTYAFAAIVFMIYFARAITKPKKEEGE